MRRSARLGCASAAPLCLCTGLWGAFNRRIYASVITFLSGKLIGIGKMSRGRRSGAGWDGGVKGEGGTDLDRFLVGGP